MIRNALPQIVYLVLLCWGMGYAVAIHGKPREGKHNAIVDILAIAIQLFFMAWGGFFDVFFR